MIGLHWSEPLWFSGRPTIPQAITLPGWTHTIQAGIGFDTARFELVDADTVIWDWLTNGLGRHIEAAAGGGVIWEGFVDKVAVTYGSLSITRGPFMNICNKVHGKYSDYSTNVEMTTATAQDTDSQSRYGIRYKIINIGQVSATNADKIRDAYLRESKYPETDQQSDFATKPVKVSIDCLGYYHLLKAPYLNVTSGTYTLREKLIEVIQSEPNGMFDNVTTDYIAENTLSVFRADNNDKLAVDVVNDLCSLGDDGTNSPVVFGIYEDRIPYYEVMPTSIEYYQSIATGEISSYRGDIGPWQIRPGKWVEFTDMPIGLSGDYNTIRDNPRYMFIKSVNFTAPYTLGLTGSKVSTLSQQLAKLGLSSIS